jgi:hypothetical protein
MDYWLKGNDLINWNFKIMKREKQNPELKNNDPVFSPAFPVNSNSFSNDIEYLK